MRPRRRNSSPPTLGGLKLDQVPLTDAVESEPSPVKLYVPPPEERPSTYDLIYGSSSTSETDEARPVPATLGKAHRAAAEPAPTNLAHDTVPLSQQPPVPPSPARKRRPVRSPDMKPSASKIAADTRHADRLGTLVSSMSEQLASANSWEEFVSLIHGRPYLAESIDDIVHPSRDLLVSFRDDGVPVVINAPYW